MFFEAKMMAAAVSRAVQKLVFTQRADEQDADLRTRMRRFAFSEDSFDRKPLQYQKHAVELHARLESLQTQQTNHYASARYFECNQLRVTTPYPRCHAD